MLTAWSIKLPTAGGTSSPGDVATYAPILITGALYLLVSTFDWLILLRLVINAVRGFPSVGEVLGQTAARMLGGAAILDDSLDLAHITDDQVVDTSIGVVYLSLYLQRHNALLQSFSTQVIDWNKGLFQADDVEKRAGE
jgi:hypothetical protein